MEFDRYRDSYREELDEATSFAGAEAGFYTEVKAELLADLALRRLAAPAELKVLDAGCGPGETDRYLQPAFPKLTGVDVSAAMIEAAAERNPWATYRQVAPSEPLPFEDASFDLSFTICVLHHIEPGERDQFMGELARVTKPSGLVAVFEHNPNNPATRKVVRDCVFDEDVSLLRMRETLALMGRQGLACAERRFILFFPWRSSLFRATERGLARLPIGAQYYVAGRPRAGAGGL
jgi:SAM-dependent methyltransferase